MKPKIDLRKEKKRCIYCGRTLRLKNRLKICSNCNRYPYWKEQYKNLKAEFDRHKVLCDRLLKEYAEKLNKYEPFSEYENQEWCEKKE
jgi:hypothetical protein